jgi:hypothetical protein
MKLENFEEKIKFKIFDKQFVLSNGIYGTHRYQDENKLNMVRNNYQAITNSLKANNLLILKHIHGNTVIDADKVTDFTHEPEADGAVTSTPGTVISIQSADCVPVLLASEDGKVIGGAHCGWRSTVANILENVVQLMLTKGASNISAIIGPAIHQSSYEVDKTFQDTILKAAPTAHKLFIDSPNLGRFLFDLPAFVRMKLNDIGIHNIVNLCENTYSHPDRFYSYRRDVHLGISGEQTNILSTILIENTP